MQTIREINSTAQKFLDIYDIDNNFLILKDGGTALIITVNAMNFGLLAEEEQDAIIYSYAGLLNSLNYPIQIVIKSQTKDVTSYLKLLDNELEMAATQTRKIWIKKYRDFVANLIRERNVLDKKFYVIIPATALEMGLVGPSTVLPGVKAPDVSGMEKTMILAKAREILEPKRDHIMSQFSRIGLISKQLSTQEIIQLFYLSYNPEASEGQQITDTNSYTTPLVRASVIKEGNMSDPLSSINSTLPTPTPVVTPTPAVNPAASPVTTPMSTPSTPTTTPATTPTIDPAIAAPVAATAMASAPMMTPPQTVNTINSTVPGGDLNNLQSEIDSQIGQIVTPMPTPTPAPAAAPTSTMSAPASVVPNMSSITSPTPVVTPTPAVNPAANPIATPMPAPSTPTSDISTPTI